METLLIFIFFSFSASPANRGKGYWKFNSQLLRDSNYIDIVKTCIRDTLSEYYSVGNIDDFLHVELFANWPEIEELNPLLYPASDFPIPPFSDSKMPE
jgi:hypothetical protein